MDDDDDEDLRSPSVSPSPSPSNPNGIQPQTLTAVTVASPSPSNLPPPAHQTLTLALPIQTPNHQTLATAGREDCWSEGATSTLIDAWGERYVHLSRGNLKQKHWQEVADAVAAAAGEDYTKTPRTDVQCKNRIDTLKKKYKLERSKISTGQSRSSTWPFFHRLDALIGPTIPTPKPFHFLPQFPQKLRTRKRSLTIPKSPAPVPVPPMTVPGSAEGVRELARAILRLGDVYGKVERSKTQQTVEMERQRMGFVRELELQRMQFFIKTQMEISQLRRTHQHRRYTNKEDNKEDEDGNNSE